MFLKKIIYSDTFKEMLSKKLNIGKETIRVYFSSGNIPEKHKEFIKEAYSLQLKADEKIKAIEIEVFEKL